MTGLDATSAEIGALRARADGADRTDKLILEKLDEIIERQGDDGAALTQIKEQLLREVLPEIRLWRAMRQRAIGGAAVVLFLISIVGSIFTDFLSGLIRKLWGAA